MQITDLTRSGLNKKWLKGVFAAADDVFGEKLGEISLVIVGNEKIREINKKYRGKDVVTDVLSFEELNEIYICLPQAKKQAKLLKTSLNSELTRLLTHGIVHLQGYDHEKSKKEAEEMREIEDKIFRDARK